MQNALDDHKAPAEWSGSQCPHEPDDAWHDDKTGEHVDAETGERGPCPHQVPTAGISAGPYTLSPHSDGESVLVEREGARFALSPDVLAAAVSVALADPVDIGGEG